MRLKLQANVNGQWKYVSHIEGTIITTDKAFEALTGDQETLNRLSAEFYGTDFRAVR
jgi:hypothetical protein